MKNDLIEILSQAFYGNKTATEIRVNEIDSFICGSDDEALKEGREIVHLPNEKNLVIIYNKHNEERQRQAYKTAYERDSYVGKPLAIIKEQNLEIYSRCFGCRMNDNGEFESLHDGDYIKYKNYFMD